MGFLDTIAADIYRGFKGKLLTGIIRQYAAPGSGALDAHGDPIVLSATDTAIEGFVEDYDDAYRARAAIPKTDVMANIFSASCPGVTPSKDDVVKFVRGGAAEWYQLRRVQTDPAKALWVGQAFSIPEPA